MRKVLLISLTLILFFINFGQPNTVKADDFCLTGWILQSHSTTQIGPDCVWVEDEYYCDWDGREQTCSYGVCSDGDPLALECQE